MSIERSVVLVATSAILLFGCGKKAPTPEEQCSAPSTYDQIVDILASQIAQARINGSAGELASAASSKQALKSVLKFELPTVAETNATTHKVSCQALMRVAADSGVQGLIDTQGLETNEVTPDHLQIRIRYSLQPTADTGTPVMELEQASNLAVVAMQASMAAVQRLRGASGGTAAGSTDVPSENSLEDVQNAPTEPSAADTPSPDQPDQNSLTSAASTGAADNGVADAASAFARDYFSQSAGDPDAALAWMASHYANSVRFFGKNVGRNDILKQKADYLRRWPERSYAIESTSVRVECKPGQPLCHVAGIIDWSAASPERQAKAAGKAAFDLVTLAQGGDQVIVAENSRVISRAP